MGLVRAEPGLNGASRKARSLYGNEPTEDITAKKRTAPVHDWFNANLLNVGQEGVVCSHALRGGDWVWLAQSVSPAG
jgi:hypothetical protein